MSPDELKHFLKVFDLNPKATAMITFKKVLGLAFSIVPERRSDNCRNKDWHSIDVKLVALRDMKAAYTPACLDPGANRASHVETPTPIFRQCVFTTAGKKQAAL